MQHAAYVNNVHSVQDIVDEFAAEPDQLSAQNYDIGVTLDRRRRWRRAKPTEGEGIIPRGYV